MTGRFDALRCSFEDTRSIFVAFGDRYRQDIIMLLYETPNMTVKELSRALKLSRPAVSHHIKILKEAGMLGERREGTKRYYYPTLDDAVARVKHVVDASQAIIQSRT